MRDGYETPPAPDRRYAPVLKRLVSHLIDSLFYVLVGACGYGLITLGLVLERTQFLVLGIFLSCALAIAVTVIFLIGIGKKGQTPGKRVMGLVIIDADAEKHIGVGRALLRQCVLMILGPLNLVQFIVIPLSKRHQGLHDMAANVIVYEGGPIIPKRPKPLPPLPPEGRLIAAPVPDPPPEAPPSLATAAPPTVPTEPPRTAPSVVAPSVPPTAGPPPAAGPPPSAAGQTRTGWTLRSAAGEVRRIEGHLLIGREPDVGKVAGSQPWAVEDPAMTVSKTHALFGVDDGVPWIEDLGSTNGVRLVRGGAETELVAHTRTPLRGGDDLLLGEFRLHLRSDG